MTDKMKLNKNWRYKYSLRDDLPGLSRQYQILKKRIRNPVFQGWPEIDYSESGSNRIIAELKRLNIRVDTCFVNLGNYRNYLDAVGYKDKYPDYYAFNFREKTLEYYLAYIFLNLKQNQRFLDVAAEHSPHSREFGKLCGCKGYMQDIMFAPGIRGNRIGGNASSVPVEDDFFHGAVAACSIEHFEGDNDKNFMREAVRILKPGGSIVIVPLYLHTFPFCVTDPRCSVPGKVTFDSGIAVHSVAEFKNRHGRYYSPETLYSRLLRLNEKSLDFRVIYIKNFREIDPSVYCRFVLSGKKRINTG